VTPPISSESLNQVLQTLPPERTDPFPHLTNLSPDGLLHRRVEITGQLKTLEQERQAIDAELVGVFSDAELRIGVRAPGGWILKQRSRTSWDYCPEVRDAIKDLQQEAQRNGRAQPQSSSHLCLQQEGI
jgi:hypothetical protein